MHLKKVIQEKIIYLYILLWGKKLDPYIGHDPKCFLNNDEGGHWVKTLFSFIFVTVNAGNFGTGG
jgi:hypothetical protein